MAQKRKSANKDAAADITQPLRKRSKQNTTSIGSNKANTGKSKTADGQPPPPTAYLLDTAPFAEILSLQERRREAVLYELLGSEDVEERILAADAIISGLLGSSASGGKEEKSGNAGSDSGLDSDSDSDSNSDSDSDSTAADGTKSRSGHQQSCVPEPVLMRHLEKRLIRGLASGRNAARLGFGLVLAELLGQLFSPKTDFAKKYYPGLSFDRVLSALTSNTRPAGSMGQELRDHYLGQLFGFEAMVRADGMLFGSDDADKKGWWMAVLDSLLQLYETKTWIRSQCGHVIVQGLHAIGANGHKTLAEKTLEKMDEASMTMTPEGVAAWIVALGHFPDIKRPKGLGKKVWKDGGHPLAAGSLATLPAVLKDCGRETQPLEAGDGGRGGANGVKKLKQQGSWAAQLHFVWALILEHYLVLGKKNESKAGDVFRQFWTKVVDETFFSKGASDSQKFSGFMVFQLMLQGGSDGPYFFIVENLFSKNFLVCLMNQAAKEDRYLHRAALKSLKAVEGAVEKQPSLAPIVLMHLLGKHGTYNFDQRTNTKTVERILQYATDETAETVLEILQHKPAAPEFDASNYYEARGTYLLKLVNVTPDLSEEEGRVRQSVAALAIQALTGLAYINQSLPDSIRDSLRTKTTAAFARLVKRPEDFGHLCAAIVSIGESITDDDSDADETAASVLEQAYERLNILLDPAMVQDKNGQLSTEKRAIWQAMALLHAMAILQYHNADPDAMGLLDELEECHNKLLAGPEDSCGRNEGVAELLVEILLAMVAQPSSLMRQVSQQVFEAFTHLMTPQALSLLTNPLEADESARGRAALFSTEEEDLRIAEDASSGEGDALDSDTEMNNLSKINQGEDDGSDESSEEQDDNEDEAPKNSDEAALAALDSALSKVLKSQKLLVGAGEDDDGSDSSDSEITDMTDSEMVAMDDKLAEIFRMRMKHTAGGKAKKKEKKDAKDTVVNFKHRVLDLLTIYVKKEPAAAADSGPQKGGKSATPSKENGAPLVFSVLLPLLELMRETTAKPLATRAHGIITEFSKGLKKARASGGGGSGSISGRAVSAASASALLALLEKIHAEASRDMSHAFAKAASVASLAVVAAALQGGGKKEARGAGESHPDDSGIKKKKKEKKKKKQTVAMATAGTDDAVDDTITIDDVEERVFGLYARTQRSWYRGEVRIQPSFFTDWMNWCQSHAAANAAAAAAGAGASGEGEAES